MLEELVGSTGTFDMGGLDIVRQVREDVLFEDLSFSPIATFLARIGGAEKTDGPKFEWQEMLIDKFAVSSAAIPSASAGVETTAVVFNSPSMRVGDVLYHAADGQKVRVTSFISRTSTTTTCKVTRVPFSSALSAITGTPSWRVLGNHMLEKGYFPIGVGGKPSWYENFCQPLSSVAEISFEMKETMTYHNSQFELDNQVAIQNLRGAQERLLLFAESHEELQSFTNENGEQSSGVSRQTNGMFQFITKVRGYSGELDKQTLNGYFYGTVWPSRLSGSRKKLMPTGNRVFEAIDDMANGQLRYYPGAEEMGLDIAEVKVAGARSVALLEEKEFMEDLNASDFNNDAMVIEPDLIKLKHLGNNFMRVFPLNVGNRALEGMVYYCSFGLEMRGRNTKHTRLTQIGA